MAFVHGPGGTDQPGLPAEQGDHAYSWSHQGGHAQHDFTKLRIDVRKEAREAANARARLLFGLAAMSIVGMAAIVASGLSGNSEVATVAAAGGLAVGVIVLTYALHQLAPIVVGLNHVHAVAHAGMQDYAAIADYAVFEGYDWRRRSGRRRGPPRDKPPALNALREFETGVRHQIDRMLHARSGVRRGLAATAIIGSAAVGIAWNTPSVTLAAAATGVYLLACVIPLAYAAQQLGVVSTSLDYLRLLIRSEA